MTRTIAAYDTERSGAHRPRPGVLAETPEDFRRLLDDPLFEVASHGWSHRVLLNHPVCGPAAAPEEIREEIDRGLEPCTFGEFDERFRA
jgi:hypothetical protein